MRVGCSVLSTGYNFYSDNISFVEEKKKDERKQ